MNLEQELEALLQSDQLASAAEWERRFEALIGPCRGRVVLFGAGALGRKIAAVMRRQARPPLAFSDNSPAKWGQQIDGIPVLAPADAAKQFGGDAVFVVAIGSPGHAFAQTRRQLAQLGCQRVAPYLLLLWHQARELLPYYAYESPEYFRRHAPAIMAGFRRLADEASRQTYFEHIRFRMQADFERPPARVAEGAYFVESLFALDEREVLVDAGAFDGDTLREYLARTSSGTAHAYEPDPGTFRKLVHYVEGLDEATRRRITCHQAALGETAGTIKFDATGTLGAAASATGEIAVEVVALDQVSFARPPTFIKMDIEGAEAGALRGARGLIATQKPVLAICAYHRPDDLWELSALAASLNPGYKFYLRSHDYDGWETVLYAIDPPRVRRVPAP
jgi:FkbM family methyltransferase